MKWVGEWHKAPASCIRARLGRPSFARMDKPKAYPTRWAGASIILLSLAAAGLLIPAEAPYSGPVFTDVTAQAGIHFVHNSGRAGKKYLPETMGSGCAFFEIGRAHV